MRERELLEAIINRDEARATRLIDEGAQPCSAVVVNHGIVFPLIAACERGLASLVRGPYSHAVTARALVAAAEAGEGTIIVSLMVGNHGARVTGDILIAVCRNPMATALLAPWATSQALANAIRIAIIHDYVGGAAVLLDAWQRKPEDRPQPVITVVRSTLAWALLSRHGLQPQVSLYEICAIAGASAYVCCAHLGDAIGMRRELRRGHVRSDDAREAVRVSAGCTKPLALKVARPLSDKTAYLWPAETKARVRTLLLCMVRHGFDTVVLRCVRDAVVR